jgi:DNA-binding CsgD family transcriptional regulator
LEINELRGRDLHSLGSLVNRPCPVGILGCGASEERLSERLHRIMASQGFGSEMRIALILGGRIWGVLTLLRETGRRSFSASEAATAGRLSAPLAAALKRYAAGRPLRPARSMLAPGIIVVGSDGKIRATSPTARDWLGTLVPHRARTNDDELFGNIWSITFAAQQTDSEVLTRIPRPLGWMVLRGQLLDGAEPDEVVVTAQPASADVLLPALTAWYGITSREQTVIAQLFDGLSTKQIARRLQLSQHTVNDHLKAIYRKTDMSGRDELVAGLSH